MIRLLVLGTCMVALHSLARDWLVTAPLLSWLLSPNAGTSLLAATAGAGFLGVRLAVCLGLPILAAAAVAWRVTR